MTDRQPCPLCDTHGPYLTATEYDVQALHRAYHRLVTELVAPFTDTVPWWIVRHLMKVNRS